MSVRRWSVLLLLVAFCPAQAQEPPRYRPQLSVEDIDFRTDWYGIYLKDRKIGYARTGRTRLPDGTIRETQLTQLKLISFGQKAEMRMEQTFVFEGTAPYGLLNAEVTSNDASLGSKKTLTRTAKGYEVLHEAQGVRHKEVLEGTEYSLADSMAQEAWVRKNPQVGDRIAIVNLDLTEAKAKFDTQTCKVLGSKKSLAGGVPVHVFEIESEWRDKGIKSLARVDAKGTILSDQLAIFELRLESEAEAKNTTYSHDLFVMGLVKLDRALGEWRTVTELVLQVEGNEASFPAGPRQSVTAGTKGPVVKLGKAHGKVIKASDQEVQENLAETSAYPISNERIQKLAREAVGNAQSPAEKVRRLVQFTHDYVRPTLASTLPQIHDLLDGKKGDCKSYALLFTNLARAAGIPTREVSGLVYVGDDYKAFGGHAWNEVVLDGVWVPIDATFNQTDIDATHLSFGSEQRATANLLNTLGKLSFRLIEVKHAR